MALDKNKGQTSLEAMVISLVIIASIFVVAQSLTRELDSLDKLYKIRATAQGVASTMSMSEDIYTTVVQVNQSSVSDYGLVLVSADCERALNKTEEALEDINVTVVTRCFVAGSCDDCVIVQPLEIWLCEECVEYAG